MKNYVKAFGINQENAQKFMAELEAMSFSFTDRESYLEYVAEWKTEYHAAVDSVKQAKRAYKEAQRQNNLNYSLISSKFKSTEIVRQLLYVRVGMKLAAARQMAEDRDRVAA